MCDCALRVVPCLVAGITWAVTCASLVAVAQATVSLKSFDDQAINGSGSAINAVYSLGVAAPNDDNSSPVVGGAIPVPAPEPGPLTLFSAGVVALAMGGRFLRPGTANKPRSMMRSFSLRHLLPQVPSARGFALLAICLAALPSAHPAWAQAGANGTDGAKGAAGAAGKDGTAGANSLGGTSGLTVTGGYGGKGGGGGDAVANGSGYDGGDGGKGGAAQVGVIANDASATAVGGRPGSGGSGSQAANRTFNSIKGGDGGNAGVVGVGATDNGDAIAEATAPTGNANARATADGNAPSPAEAGTAGVGGGGGAGRTLGGRGGNGAPGGNATATATAQGAGGEAGAFATAGRGGDGGIGGPADLQFSTNTDVRTGGAGGNGANGGNATANATAKDGDIAAAIAVAGDGGSAGAGGAAVSAGKNTKGAIGGAGNGGTANATAIDTNANGDALAASRANAGSGGFLQRVRQPDGTFRTERATPGNATATATANAPNGDATANPTAINGLGNGGTAVANGRAAGLGGGANPAAMTAQSANGTVKTRVNNRADSPIPAGAMGQVQGQAMVGIAAPLPALKPNTTLNAFAAGVGDPLISDVLATSAGKPNVTGELGIGGHGEQLGLLELGALYPTLASGATTTFTASSEFSFDPELLREQFFRVGLQDAQWTGNGFDSLLFEIMSGSTMVVDETFTSLSSAASFFDDHVIDVGSITPDSSGLLDLSFDFELTAHTPGEGFAIDLAIAAVPEPPSWLMLASALALTLVFGFRLQAHR